MSLRMIPGRGKFPKISRNSYKGWPGPCLQPCPFLALCILLGFGSLDRKVHNWSFFLAHILGIVMELGGTVKTN